MYKAAETTLPTAISSAYSLYESMASTEVNIPSSVTALSRKECSPPRCGSRSPSPARDTAKAAPVTIRCFAESFRKNLADHLAEAGIRLTMEAIPMGELLSEWYWESERTADMIYLASNFEIVFDPATAFVETSAGEHLWFNTSLRDEELYQAALGMHSTEPGDVPGYMQSWIAFQERFNTVLPMIPVYSNVYYDFYTELLRCYEIAGNEGWGKAIVGSYLG